MSIVTNSADYGDLFLDEDSSQEIFQLPGLTQEVFDLVCTPDLKDAAAKIAYAVRPKIAHKEQSKDSDHAFLSIEQVADLSGVDRRGVLKAVDQVDSITMIEKGKPWKMRDGGRGGFATSWSATDEQPMALPRPENASHIDGQALANWLHPSSDRWAASSPFSLAWRAWVALIGTYGAAEEVTITSSDLARILAGGREPSTAQIQAAKMSLRGLRNPDADWAGTGLVEPEPRCTVIHLAAVLEHLSECFGERIDRTVDFEAVGKDRQHRVRWSDDWAAVEARRAAQEEPVDAEPAPIRLVPVEAPQRAVQQPAAEDVMQRLSAMRDQILSLGVERPERDVHRVAS